MNKFKKLLSKKGNIIVNGNKKYFLFYNNCVQVSIEALMKGTFSRHNILLHSKLFILRYNRYIPNQIYYELKLFCMPLGY